VFIYIVEEAVGMTDIYELALTKLLMVVPVTLSPIIAPAAAFYIVVRAV
jgi:hypothetical protein